MRKSPRPFALALHSPTNPRRGWLRLPLARESRPRSLGEKFATGLNGAFECQIFTVATPIPDGGFDKNAQRAAQAKDLGLFS